MNRRSFFSSLAAFAGAASLSPNIFIPKLEPVKWKAASKWVRNPGWFVTEYECYIIGSPPMFDPIILHRRAPEILVPKGRSVITINSNTSEFGTWTWETP